MVLRGREPPLNQTIDIFCPRSPLPPGGHGFAGHDNSSGPSVPGTILLPSPDGNSNMVRPDVLGYMRDVSTCSPEARHIIGLALRLCIRLRYHRKYTSCPEVPNLDPYTIELRKRFFWCAYCFDRFGTRFPLFQDSC